MMGEPPRPGAVALKESPLQSPVALANKYFKVNKIPKYYLGTTELKFTN